MSKLRQDAWLKENDTLLAESVLKHVREGSTQLNAFEEAGDALNRTAAACGFRWNAVVRKAYEKELLEAKKERKEKMRAFGTINKRRSQPFYFSKETNEKAASIPISSLSLDIVIAYLVHLQHQSSEAESNKWKRIAQVSAAKLKDLENELQRVKKENQDIKEDYEQFVSIMNRARKIVALEEENRITPVFEMEKNGNLVKRELFVESDELS